MKGFQKTAEQLFEKLDIRAISDLYRLTYEELLSLDKFGDKKANNLLNAIEKSKNCSLESFIYSLNIPNVGIKTVKDLVKQFKSLDAIKRATFDELIQVADIGDIVANSIINFFKEERILKIIDDMINIGVTPVYEEKFVTNNEFEGKTVVVTGTLENYSRTQIKEKLESLGAKVSSSVSKKTDYVIVGKEAGSKYEKAKLLKLNILSEINLKIN